MGPGRDLVGLLPASGRRVRGTGKRWACRFPGRFPVAHRGGAGSRNKCVEIPAGDTNCRPVFLTDFLTKKKKKKGSRISTISEDCYRQYFKGNNLTADRLNIRSYVGSKIESMGFIFVNLKLNGVSVSSCKLYVIKKGGRPLLGREWIRVLGIYNIRIKSKEILSNLSNDPFVSQLMIEFPEVFTNKLGTCKKTISLHVCDNTPVYVRARPLALKAGVECELGRLE